MARYLLALGDRAYSSWSLRGWLLFEKFGLTAEYRFGRLYDPAFGEMLAEFAPAETVPALKIDDLVIWDSLAIAEELATRHPGAGHWPADPRARAMARTLAAAMHSGFGALRDYCPMNLRVSFADCSPPDAVLRDVARLTDLWARARADFGGDGPWLCGAYSVADAFFAPVAARIAGYNLPIDEAGAEYVFAHLTEPCFRDWRAQSLTDGPDQPFYARDWPLRDWPAPV
ncbi:glutathione S-transferase [Poseidonocella sedimentorum]|uniref:Glutathione S-transferase n=1 Tax=Poseidonocella sedimentorum TaxID=871652 RepID=A0A1I6DSL2_9RHOB|nr:glutathione S-transferase [Poseidonocella sedimentorum]SFR08367.1 glutathione S-transferase [Poseidonocella sedimentorum]